MYLRVKSEKEQNLLPLVLDLTNPSPALGWDNAERDSLSQRGPVDAVFALALIHHLAISNNVPLTRAGGFLRGTLSVADHRMGPEERLAGPEIVANAQGYLRRVHARGL